MTAIDTTTEAVERQRALLQKVIHRIAHRDDVTVLRIPADANHDADMICGAADKLLSALAAERDALRKAERDAALSPFLAAALKTAYQQGWNHREAYLLAGIDRVYGTEKSNGE
jgi:hypothetical protein